MPRDDSFIISPEQLRLRPSSRAARNSLLLSDCKACKLKPEALIGYTALTVPISAAELAAESVVFDWPFPQLIRGANVTLLCTETKVFLVDESTWLLTAITTYDFYATSTPKAIASGGGYWHFADFFNTWYLYNGQCSVMKFGDDAKYYTQDTVGIQTGCAMRGRLILGGFDPTDYWSAAWVTILTDLMTQEEPPNSSLPAALADVGVNWVWYSTIGGGDTKFIHNPTLAQTGSLGLTTAHTAANPLFLDYLRRNECGLIPTRAQDSVLCVKPLERMLVVFGYDAISVYQQFAEPIPGFGLVRTLPYGIAGRGAVGGDDSAGYLFVDDRGYLRSIDSQGQVTKLDYQEFMASMTLANIVIAYDSAEGEFYIGDGAKSFVYVVDTQALTRAPEVVMSLVTAEGDSYAMTHDLGDDDFLLVSDTFDMNIRGLKEIKGVEVGGSPDTTLEVAFDYRYEGDTSFVRTSYETLNEVGWVDFTITALEFRLVLRVSTRTGAEKIDYVRIEWQPCDFRSIRGPIRGPGDRASTR